MPRTAGSPSNGSVAWLSWLVLSAALVLRLWGIAFAGSTPLGRPDEATFAIEGLTMFTRSYGRLASGWPDGFFVIWHVMLRLERAFYDLVYGAGTVNLGCLFTVRPLAVILPVRVLSALFGTATAYVVGQIAASLSVSRPREAAVWGSAIYAVNYLVGRDGHFAVSDAALCLGVALTLLGCARAAAGRLAWLPWAGFFAGCSVGIKYSGVGLLVPCVVTGVFAAVRRRREAIRPLLVAAAAGIVGLVLMAPQLLTHWADFEQGLRGLSDRYEPGNEPPRAPGGWIFYPLFVLPPSFGWLGYVLCLGGLASKIRRLPWVAAPLVTYVVASYVLLLGAVQIVFVRYASPIVPALAAAGGAFAVDLVERLCARIELPRIAATASLVLVILTPPAARLAQFDRLLSRPDTRDLAREWLISRPAGTTVLTEGGWGHVQAIEARHAMVCQQELPATLWQKTPILAVARQPTPGGLGERGWGAIAFGGSHWFLFGESEQREFLPDLHADAAPDFLAQARGPRSFGEQSGERNWGARDPACWHDAAHFTPGDLDGPQWDNYDALFLPYIDFSTLQRPGPEIFIYENRCKHELPR
jgi:hypothetical protein